MMMLLVDLAVQVEDVVGKRIRGRGGQLLAWVAYVKHGFFGGLKVLPAFCWSSGR